MSLDNLIIQPPTSIKLDDVSVGRTYGDITFERIRADYVELQRPDSPHIFGLAKRGVLYEATIPLAEHTVANIATGFDVTATGDTINYTDTAVRERKLYFKTEDGKEFTFAKCVNVSSSGMRYVWNNLTVIPLRFWIILGTEGTVCTLGEENLPGQFRYRIETAKRGEISKTFGGITRQGSSVRDMYIHFDCDFMTLTEKDTLETLHDVDTEQTFTGIHSETYQVWFEELDPPEEIGGLWRTAGTLTITEEGDGTS
jgi:hypothetical protein